MNDGNQRWSAAARVLKDAPLRGSVSRSGANHVHIATRSFSFCQRRVWAWAFSLSSSAFLWNPSLCRDHGKRTSFSSYPAYLTRLIYASLLLYAIYASFIIQPDRTKCFPRWMISCQCSEMKHREVRCWRHEIFEIFS